MAPRGHSSGGKRQRGKPKRPSSASGAAGDDPFFEAEPKRHRRLDEDIESEDSDDDLGGLTAGVSGEDDGEEEEEETAGERKMRMTKELLGRIADAVKRRKEEEDDEEDDEDDVSGGGRVANLLRKKQLEESGRQRWGVAARVLPPGQQDGFKFIAKHRQPVTAVALTKDSDKGFSASKDGVIMEDDEEQEEDDDDEEISDEEEDGPDGEMGELEEEYRTLQANQKNILETLKQHRDDDATRGLAVKNQKVLWDKTLEMRFLLQKAFSTSNKLPTDPIKSSFCGQNLEIEQAYVDLLDSSKQTLSSMLELQEDLLERNQATKGANESLPDSNGEKDEWLEVQKLQKRLTPFRNTEIDKWQRKTQVTTGAAALKGKLHAFNQNISDQVAGYMRDPSRMVNRMCLRKSDVGVFGEDAAESASTEEGKNTEGDPELVDDSEFYHQLLKEFLESCDAGASESAFYALKKKQQKKRKLVDRRASKSRKIRYNVHEKIANFMAPVPMTVPPMASKLFENLFGNRKSTMA